MKTFLVASLALVLALLATGCQSPRAARIQEKAALFASLDPRTQKIIENGLVDVGFTAELVQMALGKPNSVSAVDTVQGRLEIWTYRNFVYAHATAVALGVNNPGTRYTPGPIVSPNAPGGGPSLASTKSQGVQSTLALADAPTGTLHVDLLEGKVAGLRLDP
jgi:hypothetical protein